MEHIKYRLAHLASRLDAHHKPFEKVTDFLIEQLGSLWFLILNAIVLLGWIEWNVGWFELPIFDPYPFPLLTLVFSLEAVFLSILVLFHLKNKRDTPKLSREYERIPIAHYSERNAPGAEKEITLEQIQREIERNSDF